MLVGKKVELGQNAVSAKAANNVLLHKIITFILHSCPTVVLRHYVLCHKSQRNKHTYIQFKKGNMLRISYKKVKANLNASRL